MILVLGATGIVGASLVTQLLQKEKKLRLGYRSEYKKQKLILYLKDHIDSKLLEWIDWKEVDILNIQSLESAMKGVTQVYHCANLVSFNERDRKELLEVNHLGTQKIIDACLEEGVKELMYVSSVVTLDKNETSDQINESNHWDLSKNHSSYEQSKYLAELEVWRGAEEGIKVIIVQPGVILSNYDFQQSSGKIFKYYSNAMCFYTKGISGFIDVADVTQRMVFLMDHQYFNQNYILVAENLPFKKLARVLRSVYRKSKAKSVSNKTLNQFAKIYGFLGLFLSFIPKYSASFWKSLESKTYYSSEKIDSIYPHPFLNIEQQLYKYARDYKTK